MEKFALLLVLIQFFLVNAKELDNLNEYIFTRDKKFDFINLRPSYTSCDEASGYNNHHFRRNTSTAGQRPLLARFCIGITLNDEEMWKHPYKYNKTRKTILDIQTNNLIVPLMVADVSDKVNDDPNFVLYKHHLDNFLNNYFGRLYQPCFVLFKFGWTKHFNGRQNIYGLDGNTTLNYPGMSAEIGKWITKSYKNVVGIGMDLPSVDPSSSTELPAFRALTDAGVYVVTNVKLDEYIPESWCTAIISPLIIKDVCSPYRLIAVCLKSKMIQPETRLHRF